MNKKNLLLIALCMIGLFIIPRTGSARMVAMSDDRLNEITGQAGIANDVSYTTFDNHYDSIPMMNQLINLGDVTMKGSIIDRSPGSADHSIDPWLNTAVSQFGMVGLGFMGLGSLSLGTHHIDQTINIDRLSIGAIRIGNDTAGPSLGSIDIIGMRTEIQGTITMSTMTH